MIQSAFHSIAKHCHEPSTEAQAWAQHYATTTPGYSLAETPEVRRLQLRVLTGAYPGSRTPKALLVPEPEPTAEEIEAENLRRVIEHDRDASTRLMGRSSIYAGISLYDEAQTRKTQVVDFLLNGFNAYKSKNCLILGGTGSGKTYGVVGFVSSMASVWGSDGIDAIFMTAYQLYDLQRTNYEDSRRRRELVEQVRYLIIDDLGTEPQAGFANSDFLSYFQNLFIVRHANNRSTFITSNHTLKKFVELYGNRLESRFRDAGGVLWETKDPDFRKEPHHA